MIPIVPALIPKSVEHIKEMVQKVGFSREIQLDLVDGKFTKNISWPYQPFGDPMEVKHIFDPFTLEVDLMVTDPIPAAHAWIAAGADMLVFHMSSLSLDEFKHFVDAAYVTVGIAAHGEFDIEKFVEYAEHADYIQIMGIKEIGAQGQPFNEPILGKIEELRKLFPNKVISVDGSVNQDTIMSLKKVGVTRMIVGSAIVLQDDPQKAHQELSKLING